MEKRWHLKLARKLSLESTGLLGASNQKMELNNMPSHRQVHPSQETKELSQVHIRAPHVTACAAVHGTGARCAGEEGRGHPVTCPGNEAPFLTSSKVQRGPPPLPHSANSSACLHPISALSPPSTSAWLLSWAAPGRLGFPRGGGRLPWAAVDLGQTRALPQENLHLSSPPPPPAGFSTEAKTRNKRAIKSNEDVLVRTFDWLVPAISPSMPDVQLFAECSYICVLCIKPLWLNLNPWLLYILNQSETSQHLQKLKIYQHIELLLSHEFLICIHSAFTYSWPSLARDLQYSFTIEW